MHFVFFGHCCTHQNTGRSWEADHSGFASVALGALSSLVTTRPLQAGRADRTLETDVTREPLRSLQTGDARVAHVALFSLADAVLHHTALACLEREGEVSLVDTSKQRSYSHCRCISYHFFSVTCHMTQNSWSESYQNKCYKYLNHKYRITLLNLSFIC